MFGLGLPEIVVILVVLFLLFSGSGGEKMTGLAKSLGKFVGEFKKGKDEMEKEWDITKKDIGADKITNIGKSIGRFTGEFKKGKEDAMNEQKNVKKG